MITRIKKISIIILLVSVIGGSLTFVMTWRNIGFGDEFLSSWMTSFILSLCVLAPLGAVVSIMLDKLIYAILPQLSKLKHDILFGLSMAIVMEAVMALVTTLNLKGFLNFEVFFGFWSQTLLTALPLGILISIILSLIIKPRLELFWNR